MCLITVRAHPLMLSILIMETGASSSSFQPQINYPYFLLHIIATSPLDLIVNPRLIRWIADVPNHKSMCLYIHERCFAMEIRKLMLTHR